jgi:hypothetical protein
MDLTNTQKILPQVIRHQTILTPIRNSENGLTTFPRRAGSFLASRMSQFTDDERLRSGSRLRFD